MSSSAQDAIPQLNLGNTFGALFIGVVLAAVLFGLTNVQAFIYFQAHKSAAGITFFKLVVTWLWIFDALHLALTVHCVYYYLVTNYANFGVLTEIVWSLKLQLVINIFIIPMVHLLYVHRIWKVSKGRSRVLPAIALCIVVVLSSGVAIPLVWAQYKVNLFKDLVGIEWSTYLSLGAATFVDFLIASSLCYLLATSRTGFSSTDSFITKLVGYTISTGCLTSVCSMSIIITCAVMPTTFIFIGLQFLVTKLYVNSFIAFLNARYYMQANVIINSPQFYERHGVYHPELHISASQDEEFQKSQKDPEDEVLHTAQPIQTAMP
ncbi:uncharacterized protein BJ212DRAFT_1381520 [Suillus subaureus]|uniref:DUF6534 domain-containing protein n=1 Tax=Suillus subaureus TaxID=48587 RepID=A0A9P7E2A8_9AGAM|nr:uncharacterized protein BJ212DRAFT_1381520 [Suillus subaureus]KAG1808926.1 hypothetical protein BJ212DRAFT_1381520 [Suillus subaureus]